MIKILYAPSATAHVQKRGKDISKTKLLATSHNSSDFGLRLNLMMTWTRSLPMMLNALEATYHTYYYVGHGPASAHHSYGCWVPGPCSK